MAFRKLRGRQSYALKFACPATPSPYSHPDRIPQGAWQAYAFQGFLSLAIFKRGFRHLPLSENFLWPGRASSLRRHGVRPQSRLHFIRSFVRLQAKIQINVVIYALKSVLNLLNRFLEST